MAEVEIKYKNTVIGSTSATGSLKCTTAGKYCDADIYVNYTRPAAPVLDGNAAPSDVLSGQTFYNNDLTKKTGTMTNNGSISASIGTQGSSYTIPAGYHNGSGKVTANINNATASVDLSNNTAGAVTANQYINTNPTITWDSTNKKIVATYSGSKTITGTAGSVTPRFNVTAAGYIASTKTGSATSVAVNSATVTTAGTSQIDPTTLDANLASANIISGKTIFGVAGNAVVLNGETRNETQTTKAATYTPSSGKNAITSITVTATTGSASVSEDTITANPTLSTTYTTGSGYKMSVSASKTINASVSTAGWITSVNGATVSASGEAYVSQNSFSEESATPASYTILNANAYYKLSAGYYPTDRYYKTPAGESPAGLIANNIETTAYGTGVPLIASTGLINRVDMSTLLIASDKTLSTLTNYGNISMIWNYGSIGTSTSYATNEGIAYINNNSGDMYVKHNEGYMYIQDNYGNLTMDIETCDGESTTINHETADHDLYINRRPGMGYNGWTRVVVHEQGEQTVTFNNAIVTYNDGTNTTLTDNSGNLLLSSWATGSAGTDLITTITPSTAIQYVKCSSAGWTKNTEYVKIDAVATGSMVPFINNSGLSTYFDEVSAMPANVMLSPQARVSTAGYIDSMQYGTDKYYNIKTCTSFATTTTAKTALVTVTPSTSAIYAYPSAAGWVTTGYGVKINAISLQAKTVDSLTIGSAISKDSSYTGMSSFTLASDCSITVPSGKSIYNINNNGSIDSIVNNNSLSVLSTNSSANTTVTACDSKAASTVTQTITNGYWQSAAWNASDQPSASPVKVIKPSTSTQYVRCSSAGYTSTYDYFIIQSITNCTSFATTTTAKTALTTVTPSTSTIYAYPSTAGWVASSYGVKINAVTTCTSFATTTTAKTALTTVTPSTSTIYAYPSTAGWVSTGYGVKVNAVESCTSFGTTTSTSPFTALVTVTPSTSTICAYPNNAGMVATNYAVKVNPGFPLKANSTVGHGSATYTYIWYKATIATTVTLSCNYGTTSGTYMNAANIAASTRTKIGRVYASTSSYCGMITVRAQSGSMAAGTILYFDIDNSSGSYGEYGFTYTLSAACKGVLLYIVPSSTSVWTYKIIELP